MVNDRDKLVRTVMGQLEADRTLGGRWLPVGPLRPHLPDMPGAAERVAAKDDEDHELFEEPVMSHKTADATELQEKKDRLQAIARDVAACTRCEALVESRTHTVPGEGSPDARIVFVGEAPGATEDEQGLPFVGRAGQLLTKIIEAMGLERKDVFICNTLKCRPPGNRDPQLQEIVNCSVFLHEQLQIIDPEIIIALGAHAAKTLLETTDAIGKLRGKFHYYVPGPGAEPIKLMATYHPAYLLRNYSPDNRRRVWEDMQQVLRELGLPVPKGKG